MKRAGCLLTVVILSGWIGTDAWAWGPGGKGGARKGGGPSRPGGAGISKPSGGPAGAAKASPGRAEKPSPQRSEGKALAGERTGNAANNRAERANTGQLQSFLNGAAANASLPAAAYEPFSPAWYAAHPAAWQLTHPYADEVVAATAASLGTFLGAVAADAATSDTVVVEASAQPASSEDTANQTAAQNSTPAAAPAAVQPADDTEWLNVGVFALAPAGQTDATRIVHLAVSKEGALRGNHYDLLSDDATAIIGSIDKKTLKAAWTIGDKGPAIFETPLADLQKAKLPVQVRFADGKTGTWQLTKAARPAP